MTGGTRASRNSCPCALFHSVISCGPDGTSGRGCSSASLSFAPLRCLMRLLSIRAGASSRSCLCLFFSFASCPNRSDDEGHVVECVSRSPLLPLCVQRFAALVFRCYPI